MVQAWSVIAGEVPTTAKWNIIGTNFSDLETRLSNVSSGHNHDGVNSRLIEVNRAFPFSVSGGLVVGVEKGGRYIIPKGLTVVLIKAKTDSGSCVIRIKKNSTTVEDNIPVSNAVSTFTSIDSPALAADQILTMEVISVDNAIGLLVTVECTQP